MGTSVARSTGRVRVEQTSVQESFAAFFADAEPRLRRALVARLGAERGREATAEALAWAFEHWSEVEPMTNGVGYLYRVGISRTRARKPIEPERLAALGPPPSQVGDEVDPELWAAVTDLSDNQRVAVVLVHAFGWAMRDVADLLGVSVPTVGTHLRRGLATLRRRLADNPAPNATEAGTSTSTTTSTTAEDPDA
jgi:DNA-directed RNA polymerase specialized sigma24 family protein